MDVRQENCAVAPAVELEVEGNLKVWSGSTEDREETFAKKKDLKFSPKISVTAVRVAVINKGRKGEATSAQLKLRPPKKRKREFSRPRLEGKKRRRRKRAGFECVVQGGLEGGGGGGGGGSPQALEEWKKMCFGGEEKHSSSPQTPSDVAAVAGR